MVDMRLAWKVYNTVQWNLLYVATTAAKKNGHIQQVVFHRRSIYKETDHKCPEKYGHKQQMTSHDISHIQQLPLYLLFKTTSSACQKWSNMPSGLWLQVY